MSLGRNLLAGLANSVWSALVGLAVVPFYLKYLGIEAYGLIGFFVTTQAVLSLLDMGMAPTINREVARCSVSGNLKEAGKLLHTLAVVYWSMAGAIALLVLMLAPLIAEYWLQSKQLSPQTISHAVMLMGLVVACRWPIGLYQGALIGAQRLAVSSGINMVMVTIGSLGAVAVLAFVSPTIEAFFIWQAGVGLVYATAMRLAAWRIIGRSGQVRFDIGSLKSVWKFTAGMSGIALTGLVFTQLDKVILSKILALQEFGYYMLATVVVSVLYVIVTPLFNVMYPRFSALVVSSETADLNSLYRLTMRFLASLLFPAMMFLGLFSEKLVFVWTGNAELAAKVAPVIVFLVLGSTLHGLMFLPYALQLAYGLTQLILRNNVILVVALTPLIVAFSILYGALGGGIAWFAVHVISAVLVTWQVQRNLLDGAVRCFLADVSIPLALSIVMGLLGHYLILADGYSSYTVLACGAVLTLITALMSLLSSSKLRHIAMNAIGWKLPDRKYG